MKIYSKSASYKAEGESVATRQNDSYVHLGLPFTGDTKSGIPGHLLVVFVLSVAKKTLTLAIIF